MTSAWEAAHAAARDAGVSLCPLTTVEDADAVNHVIATTWGGQHLDREVVRALAVSGNVPWGAVAGDELVGFVLGWAGVDEDGLHVHSHMLASVPDRRHRGVGYALKLAQRAQALDEGIGVVRWTFDPLVARNAWFNLGKLGAVIDRFSRSFYGEMEDDINRGERSDRCFVRWDLRPEPGPWSVVAPEGLALTLRRLGDGMLVEPGLGGPPLGDVAIVEVPAEYHALRSTDPGLAERWRDATADAIDACLAAGMIGAAFWRERSAYVFARGPLARAQTSTEHTEQA
jgi:predicted GNAT superfamily acetyltransferase